MENTITELKKIVDQAGLEGAETIKRQLDLLATLPGEYNQQVFDKLLELAQYDPKAILVFIEQFIKTSQKILGK